MTSIRNLWCVHQRMLWTLKPDRPAHVFTTGCGSECWALAVSTPGSLHLLVWVWPCDCIRALASGYWDIPDRAFRCQRTRRWYLHCVLLRGWFSALVHCTHAHRFWHRNGTHWGTAGSTARLVSSTSRVCSILMLILLWTSLHANAHPATRTLVWRLNWTSKLLKRST